MHALCYGIIACLATICAVYSAPIDNIVNNNVNMIEKVRVYGRHNKSKDSFDASRHNRVRDNVFVPGSSNWTMARVDRSTSTELLLSKLKSMHIQTNPQRTHREPIPNNTNVMEVMMIRRELETFSKTLQLIKQRNCTIRGFYHTSAWQTFWKEVISEQLLLLDGKRKIPLNMDASNQKYIWDYNNTWTSLLGASDQLYFNIVGSDEADVKKMRDVIGKLPLEHAKKIHYNFNTTVERGTYRGASPERKAELDASNILSEGEYSTITELHDYCKRETAAGRNSIVYYMHNKGGCCFKKNPQDRVPVHAWRDEMNAMIAEFPSICTRALMKGYSTCGAENQDGHYSGNFWWADCQHVAHLGKDTPHVFKLTNQLCVEPLSPRFDAWSAEWFVLKVDPHNGGINHRFGYQCGYSVHNCGLNLYDHECKRDFYREKLYRYVSGKLGPNMVATTVNDTSLCREVKKKSYKGQSRFLDKNLLHHDKLHGGPKHRRLMTCVADDF